MNSKALCVALLLLLLATIRASAQAPATPKESQITVNVLGDVNKPLRCILPVNATVLDALASAGGLTPFANPSRLKIIHAGTAETPDVTMVNLKDELSGMAKATPLRDGDTMVVFERRLSASY